MHSHLEPPLGVEQVELRSIPVSELEQWQAQRVFVLFLPPYSPELNRIEGLWRKIKYESLPIQAYQTFESLCREVRTALDRYASSCQAICA